MLRRKLCFLYMADGSDAGYVGGKYHVGLVQLIDGGAAFFQFHMLLPAPPEDAAAQYAVDAACL